MAQNQSRETAHEPVKATENVGTSEGHGVETKAGEEQGSTVGITRGESQATEMERPQRGGLGRSESITSPFSLMQRMMSEMDRMFSRFGFGGGIVPSSAFEMISEEPAWSPVIETFERDGELVLRAELPGMKRDDVNVQVNEDELVICGKREHEEERSSGGHFYSERRYGSFERRIALPSDIDPDQIDACFENGVLEVCLKVPEERSRSRKIEVKGGRSAEAHGSEAQSSEGEQAPRSVH